MTADKISENLCFRVEPGQAGRVDRVLAARFPGASRKRLAELFARGAVRVAGRAAKKGDIVPVGADIELGQPPLGTAELVPVAQPDLPLAILHQDPAMVVLCKPAAMPSHPLRAGEGGTLANALVARFPECGRVAEDVREGGLAHRLDIGTTGVIVAARTRPAWRALRKAFGRGDIDKLYWAVVAGHDIRAGRLDAAITQRGKRAVVTGSDAAGALPARTEWRVLEHLGGPGAGAEGPHGGYTLLACTARTGRMHQVRVHLAHVGTPILGDTLYGGAPMSIPGHLLHARAITLPHPTTGERMTITAPLPPEREALLHELRAP